MLVPEIVNKPKFGVMNGKIVSTGTVGVEQLVKYDMNDFTEEELRSLIEAGHEDYFDDSEKDKLKELGILEKELDPQLNDYSWSEIKDLIKSGRAADYLKVGDTKDITLNLPAGSYDLVAGKYFSGAVSGTYKVVILGIDHNSAYEGTNRVHFCIGRNFVGTDIAFSSMKMNTAQTNSGGWAGCPMRTWLNETLINGLPSDLTDVITPCTKYTNNTGNSNAESDITSTSDKLWLLSEFEVFGSRKNANQYEHNYQKQYTYYKNGISTIRYHHQSTGSTFWWWLRSAGCNDSDKFCFVNSYGSADRVYVNYAGGVVLGFTIS